MSGIDYLLDTNFILGMLKSSPQVIERLQTMPISAGQCAYSAVTRMELLGFP
jgi:predicted nucleic acid-binding protein